MKRFLVTSFSVLVTKAVVGGVYFGLLYADAESSPTFRAEGTEAHHIAILGYVAWAATFVFLFARGGQQPSLRGGLLFGLVVWLFYFVPMTLGIYGYFAVEETWVAAALAGGLAESLACGAIAAVVYARRNAVAR